MADNIFSKSNLPIRKTHELLPKIFQTDSNKKFLGGVLDPLVQPGTLEKTVGYIGKRYGKVFNNDLYLDNDETLRSRYQLEPGIVVSENEKIKNFYDYLDLKNQLLLFKNEIENDNLVMSQDHFSWTPPVDYDKLVNFRDYYWVPEAPPPILITGQSQDIVSTYRVKTSGLDSFIFYPDGITNNPTLKLYRGQTYKFIVDLPGDGLIFRTTYDVSELRFDPESFYKKGALVLYDNKLWRALRDVSADDGSSITRDSEDWEYVEPESTANSITYNNGITNNGIEVGTIEFTVPFDAPDILYYQSLTNPNKLGRIIVDFVDTNTKLDINNDILGKLTYKSSNGIEFSNGMAVKFVGDTSPTSYSTDEIFIVEGVGEGIKLVKFSDLVTSIGASSTSTEILFDNAGFDTEPFDDATYYPATKDYIVINRSSQDLNAWSRNNRWFHRSVLEYANQLSGSDFDALETRRAKRPIIEFKSDIQLFQHGSIAKSPIDFIDTTTTDVFSIIEGSLGYIVDGEELFQGARVLFIADTDPLANNKIYEVNFITHNGRRQISLKEVEDSQSNNGECVLVKKGRLYQRTMFYFDGSNWKASQEKTTVNQEPLFDMFDENGVSLADTETYPVSTFLGTNIFSYKKGSSITDTELGFQLSYLNIDNIGDIQFDFNLEFESFSYQIDNVVYSKELKTAFYYDHKKAEFFNGWTSSDTKFFQPVIDFVIVDTETSQIEFNSVDWKKFDENENNLLVVYVDNNKEENFQRTGKVFVFNNPLLPGQTVTIKIFSDAQPDKGFYELPVGLEKNPLNDSLNTLTYGTIKDHLDSSLEFFDSYIRFNTGTTNLRDISGYQSSAKRILKHNNVAPLSLLLLCDKNINLIKSIQYASKKYEEFKNSFINLSIEVNYSDDPRKLVDYILEEFSKGKTSSTSFADSDMVGSGAYTSIVYEVEDEGIKTFALTEKFDLETLSNKAIYVYIGNQQLLHGIDYNFDSAFGFVRLSDSIELTEGDIIEIREYISTGNNYIPATPTKMGLYKKYTPRKFVDDTYQTPVEVIQGHDGSITLAYGDFRDDVLLELELRIYNNIKKEYRSEIFDIDATLGGYYQTAKFNRDQVTKILGREFLRWISDTDVDYINNVYFDSENSFTYTYSNMVDPSGAYNLPGYWRGVYKWVYDTDRPHTCPWEMFGFSEKPDWWESEYGSAPYTSGNLILWEDVRDGVIKQGTRKGTYPRYSRPSVMSHLPVDEEGKLLSPLDSGFAFNFTLINNKGEFKVGDISPAEYAWTSSSSYPFAITILLSLIQPFEFVLDGLDNSSLTNNILGQTVNKITKTFSRLSDVVVPESGKTLTTGLIVYILNYLQSKGIGRDELVNVLSSIDVKLSTRLSGFVDKDNQRYVLDSKNPNSTSGSIFIPQENYDIIFNTSAPILSLTYSGIIIEKVDRGWKISGYDKLDTYFRYFETVPSQKDPTIYVGGVSEDFVKWVENKFYGNGIICFYSNFYYRCLKSHTSGSVFEESNWQKLAMLPKVGGVEALLRKNFNRLNEKILPYGKVLTSIQQVVDFILGYQENLISKGFIFNSYNPSISSPNDWFTSIKEFMFWTKHNWEIGSLISVSPAANTLEVSIPVGVADNLLDNFYEYSILQADGTPLDPSLLNFVRDFQKITIKTEDTNRGIYHINLLFVLKEHVTVFDDRTVFNDVIYDKSTGYRQERIKSRGFRTVDWDGDYTSPGFLFDNVNIEVWQPYTDYKLGDIVSYKSYNWVSLINHTGEELFDDANWEKLDSTPEKRLVPNFDYRINQFEDYYNLDSDGIGDSQRDLGRHIIGYQNREYLQELVEDDVIQFKLFQGYIKEKGTSNSIIKVFDKTSSLDDDSIVLKEEWAFLIGKLGGTDQLREIEFNLKPEDLGNNPQPLIFTDIQQTQTTVDRYLRIDPTRFSIKEPVYSTDINPVSKFVDLNRNNGYAKIDHITYSVKDKAELLSFDIDVLFENDFILLSFDIPNQWNVYQFNVSKLLLIEDLLQTGTSIELTFNRPHPYNIGDLIGIKDIANLVGFFEITSKSLKTITIEIAEDADPPEFEPSTIVRVYDLNIARFKNYTVLSDEKVASSSVGSRFWVDNNGDNNWEVIEKSRQYTYKDLIDFGIAEPEGVGVSVLYSDPLQQIFTGVPRGNYVLVYKSGNLPYQLTFQYLINPPDDLVNKTNNSFGNSLQISIDGRFLIIGAPLASGVTSKFRGNYTEGQDYFIGDIVLHNNRLWRATERIVFESSTTGIYTDRWEPVTIVESNSTGQGSGYLNQGCVIVYEYIDQQWVHQTSILSPFQTANENFGHRISLGKSGTTYYMAVSAPGAFNNRGRVYLYTYTDSVGWKHYTNENFAGAYQPVDNRSESLIYTQGTIVYWNEKLYQASTDIPADGSTIAIDDESSNWVEIDPITTDISLPKNIFYNLPQTINAVTPIDAIAALTKEGDNFGFSIAMNATASVLVIGAPDSDGQFFANYKGDWISSELYRTDDVVRNNNQYYKLEDPRLDKEDSTDIFVSINETPENGSPWIVVGDSSDTPTGKVFIYARENNSYVLKQTITADTLSDINETGSVELISSGDQFGYDVDIDQNGYNIIISSPKADINLENQGTVYFLETSSLSNISYKLKQKLQSYERTSNELFGHSISIAPGSEKIVVGAKNTPYKKYVFFDITLGTSFDRKSTVFSSNQGYTGQAYVFQRKDQKYFLSEKLEPENITGFESFGNSVDVVKNNIVVGSPNYKIDQTLGIANVQIGNQYTISSLGTEDNPTDFTTFGAAENSVGVIFTATKNGSNADGRGTVIQTLNTGKIRLFEKSVFADPLKLLAVETDLVDISKIHSIIVYDNITHKKLADVDFVDHFKNKFLGIVEQEINFKTLYDPAIYTVGTDEQIVDPTQNWREKYIGYVWWDLSNAKWTTYEQGDISYRIGNWNSLAIGASIDVYEWVESTLLPSEWNLLADTVEGLSLGISGQPLYPDDTVYSKKEITNSVNQTTVETYYYYWVKNKTVVPDVSFRRISVDEVRQLIENPASSGAPIVAFLNSNSMLMYNFDSIITNQDTYINIQYKKQNSKLNAIHKEYQLLTEGQADSVPSEQLEIKWIDSLVGFDQQGNTVPDSNLSERQKYGLAFRPRQSMFKNRESILKIVFDNVNNILLTQPFTDLLNFERLNFVDSYPIEGLNQYDEIVDTKIDLDQIGTVRLKQAVLSADIRNGELDSISIVDPGYGYKVPPEIVIQGDGEGAFATCTIDSQGRINQIEIITSGRKYSAITIKVREFSVLVLNDSSSTGFWAIYSWDSARNNFYKSKSQAYDVTRYWEYIDWWKDSNLEKIKAEITDIYQEYTLNLDIGDNFRVREFASGGWAVLKKVEDGTGTIGGRYELIGRENGTIRFKESLYNRTNSPIGFDNLSAFDTTFYDLQPTKELRYVLDVIKNDIFINDYSAEWNKLFFICVNYAFSEQDRIDWAFKTSFLTAIHNVGYLEQKVSYKNDNLESYQKYLEEVKPYRTTVREYISRYINIETPQISITDFDLPSRYDNTVGRLASVGLQSEIIDSYPWKFWKDNRFFEIVAIEVTNVGSGYTSPPTVIIDGDGAGASATAYITNGRVSAIKVTNSGEGYLSAPIIRLVGGNGVSGDTATAVAVLGRSPVRSFDLTLKFDRVSKDIFYTEYSQSQRFIASGNSAVFELNYPPTRDKSKISIYKNSQLVLNNEYSVDLYYDSNSLLKGKVIFLSTPLLSDIIDITYEKSDLILNSNERIDRYYQPVAGMKGKHLEQLMTGIDYGGVQIQGNTFDVTGGWDAVPWFTDTWDSVDTFQDFYFTLDFTDYVQSYDYKSGNIVRYNNVLYVANDNSNNEPPDLYPDIWSILKINLPYTPDDGQQITIYLKPFYSNTLVGLTRDSTLEQRIEHLQILESEPPPRTRRIDDFYWDNPEDRPSGIRENLDALMPTFVGDGSTITINIVNPDTNLLYFPVSPGDQLIFRPLNSDGSILLTDPNLIDTNISGGSFNSVFGMLAEEISIDGGSYIGPDQVPATEENIPGQVLDSVSIKVYNTYKTGSVPIQNKTVKGDGITTIFSIDLNVIEKKSVMVYINKTKKVLDTDYLIDIKNNNVIFAEAPSSNSIVEIIAIGVGGVEILDYQEFTADGETLYFLTSARYIQTTNVFATVNGIQVDVNFIESSEIVDNADYTLIQFPSPVELGSTIKIIALGVGQDVDSTGLSLARLNRETFLYDGSSKRFSLSDYVTLSRGSSQSSALVSVNGEFLTGVDTTIIIYDGSNNEIEIGVDPEELPGGITAANIKVFVNGELKNFVEEYLYQSSNKLVIVSEDVLEIGDTIKIETNLRTQFSFVDNDLLINDSVSLVEDDIIEIIWFNEYPSLDIYQDEYSGGVLFYTLSRTLLDINYVWVFKNGERLTKDEDYSLDLNRNILYLSESTTETDSIKIVSFSDEIYNPPIAYEIYKDMLNTYQYNRYSKNKDLYLTTNLNYYDNEIYVSNGDLLFEPSAERNLPGTIIINNERIQYLVKTGNVLSQLRRGVQGTGIATIHLANSHIIDVGPKDKISYNDGQIKHEFYSDGSSLLIGPLNFVPTVRKDTSGNLVDFNYRDTIPLDYYACDEIEIFVGGKRLNKDSTSVYSEELGAYSPEADIDIEAEFSVDGINPYVRLTVAPQIGSKITIIKRTGNTWYDKGEITASLGVTLKNNQNSIMKFISSKTSELPE